MQYHLNGFKPGNLEISDAARVPADPPPIENLPKEVDVLIVGCGPAGLTMARQLAGIRRINHVFLQVSKYLFQKSAPYPESFRENPCNSWLSTNIKPSGSGLDCDFS